MSQLVCMGSGNNSQRQKWALGAQKKGRQREGAWGKKRVKGMGEMERERERDTETERERGSWPPCPEERRG